MAFPLPTAAVTGFAPANTYDAHRPSYPPEAVSGLLSHMGLAGIHGAKVVEIASGTGKFTQLLAAREEEFEILAVEPHEGMRRELETKNLQGVKVMDGHASKTPVGAEWGEGCIAAQAFHWFATAEALTEIHRVLRTGASFGMIWNVESYNQPQSWPTSSTWERDLSNMIMELDDGHGRFRHMKWMDVFDEQLKSNPIQALNDSLTNNMPCFSLPVGTDKMEWTTWLQPEQLWKRLSTLSQLVVMNDEEKARTREIFDRAMAREDCVKNNKGEVPLKGCTFFAWTQAL
ncbi:putative methyltransferase protein [Zalerion maritima]|uniref:Methyltransferase protein n=1 Tax=Zalerion maritima TaxID=339359 RepID=A0AAD5RVH3_9PEZI|nr:putative methyltransferase protein [Zalerion maritima]